MKPEDGGIISNGMQSDLLNGVEITDERRRLVAKNLRIPSFVTNLEVAKYCQKMKYKLRMIGRISFS